MKILKRDPEVVSVFYACDRSYIKYMMVSICSLSMHTSPNREYEIYILHEELSANDISRIRLLEEWNISIHFINVSVQMKDIVKNLSLRDYYTKTTYYRFLIPELFPEIEKAVYLDGDTILLEDVAKLYDYEVEKYDLAAVQDQIIADCEIFNTYSERTLGIPGEFYFNAGVLLINCRKFRKKKILEKFETLVRKYAFVVAQDQDYLNVLCQGKVLWLPDSWNRQMYRGEREKEETNLIHYNLESKPWNSLDCILNEYFWDYARLTPYYADLKEELVRNLKRNFKNTKRQKLELLAQKESYRTNNYRKQFGKRDYLFESRLKVKNKMKQLEKHGEFNTDVEEDPESFTLEDYEIEYLDKKITDKISRSIAFFMADRYRNLLKRRKQLVINEIRGLENLENLDSGAVITCNHFNPFESFAIQEVFEAYKELRKNRQSKDDAWENIKFYRVIREGNYTNFPGFYGYLMRNCDTLPLSSSKNTMMKFVKAADEILKKGNWILLYPEQSMWWNYRKPRPVKKGAFILASRNKVPVIPVFITMDSLKNADKYGYPVQAYTIHVGKPIYPNSNLGRGADVKELMDKNEKFWNTVYRNYYNLPIMKPVDENNKATK